jgi:glutaminyl-peptide cyclotransferase
MTSYSATEIDTIEHFILLDLLGAPDPMIRSYFVHTGWLFDSMETSESRLAEIGALNYGNEGGATPKPSFFIPRRGLGTNMGYIADDHVPFLNRGVEVLHLIPSPFPRVWHTLQVCLAFSRDRLN